MQDLLGKGLAALAGAGLCVVFGALGLDALRDYRAFGETATRSTLAAAVAASAGERRWVSIEGAPWRCADLVRGVDGGVAFLPARDENGATVVARFDHAIACDAVIARPLTGIVEPMSAKRAAALRAAGLALGDGPLRTLDVCAFCGKDNARLGVVVCGGFVLLGLLLHPLRRAYQGWRARAAASLRAAIHAPPSGAGEADRAVRARGAVVLALGVAMLVVEIGRAHV